MESTKKHEATGERPKSTGNNEKTEAKAKGSSQPRPRKWDYGISPEGKIHKVAKDTGDKAEGGTFKGDVAGDWLLVKSGMSCAEYTAAGGSRHGLRVMARRKMITITGPDGTVYPKEYVAPAPKVKVKATSTAKPGAVSSTKIKPQKGVGNRGPKAAA